MVNQHSEINFIFSKILRYGVRRLRVNETKLTLRNAYILDLFALGGEKESKYNERTFFWGLLAET